MCIVTVPAIYYSVPFFTGKVLDDKNVRRRFRASNYQSTTRVKPFICTMPMRLDDGWNQIQFNLSDFTRRAYGTNYIETLRVQVMNIDEFGVVCFFLLLVLKWQWKFLKFRLLFLYLRSPSTILVLPFSFWSCLAALFRFTLLIDQELKIHTTASK